MPSLLFDRELFGFRFRYPDTFVLTENLTFATTAGSARATRHVALMHDADNMVVVSRRELSVDSTAITSDRLRHEMDTVVARLTPDSGQSTETMLDGLRCLAYAFETPGRRLHQHYLVLFDHALQYTINFQSTADGRAAIDAARELVLATFEHRPP